jgi:hypothetical protein
MLLEAVLYVPIGIERFSETTEGNGERSPKRPADGIGDPCVVVRKEVSVCSTRDTQQVTAVQSRVQGLVKRRYRKSLLIRATNKSEEWK